MASKSGKPAGRRRQKNLSGGRTKMIGVWVSDAELKQLQRLAESAGGWSVPRLLLERALADQSGVTRSEHDFLLQCVNGLATEVNRVGVNLNQIAHATNAGNSLPVELKYPLAEMLIELQQLARRGRSIYDHVEVG